MDGLIIAPLRGLIDHWFTLSYNLYIPSGLKHEKIILLNKPCENPIKCSIEIKKICQLHFIFGLKVYDSSYAQETLNWKLKRAWFDVIRQFDTNDFDYSHPLEIKCDEI